MWPVFNNSRNAVIGFGTPFINIFNSNIQRLFFLIPRKFGLYSFPSNEKNLTVSIANDQSELTENQVTDLVNSIIFGVVIVVLVLLFFLGFKNALFVGIAIPMSMFMSLAILGALGNTLNTMILFGLILGLGMLVDNAVVVVENVYRLMEKEGMNRIEATKKGISEIAFPIIISTATTVAAFIPLGLWPGRIGKFMIFFPMSESFLISSLSISPVDT